MFIITAFFVINKTLQNMSVIFPFIIVLNWLSRKSTVSFRTDSIVFADVVCVC